MEYHNNNSPLTTLLSEFSLPNTFEELINIQDILTVQCPTTKPHSPPPPQPYRSNCTGTKGKLETNDGISQDEGDGPGGEDEPTEEQLRTNRLRAAHNMYEKKRRKKLNEKLKALHSLVPNSRAETTADMLDDIITYIKAMQHQVEVGTYLARATAAAAAAAASQYQHSSSFGIPGLQMHQHSACVPLLPNPALMAMAMMHQAAGFPTTSSQAPTQQWMPTLSQGDENLNEMPLPPTNLLTTLPPSSASLSSTMPPPFPYSFPDASYPPSYRG